MTRFYPTTTTGASAAPQLIVQSNGSLWRGNDSNGTFTHIAVGFTFSNNCNFQQMFDPVTQAVQLFVVDGQHIPVMVNALGVGTQVTTGIVGTNAFLPNDPNGNPITPSFVCEYQYHLVYAGQPNDPTAIYISDALNPQNFNGFSITDTQGVNYTQYYPAGRDSSYGNITGIATVGQVLIIFFTSGIFTMQNSGVYSATQYTFNNLSPSIGNKSPRSLIKMDNYIAFHGGDKFYATDAVNFFAPIPDEIPTFYSNTVSSTFPPLIINNTTLFGWRKESQMQWSYDSTGTGILDSILMFDTASQGGWVPGQLHGGAWAPWQNMPVNCAVECRGPGDNFQLFWGSSTQDLIAQHDYAGTPAASGGFNDFGAPILMEVRTKAFLFDTPANPKTVMAVYVMMDFNTLPFTYSVTVQPYVYFDSMQVLSNNTLVFQVPQGAAIYDTGVIYDDGVLYESGALSFQETNKGYMPFLAQGLSISPGFTESSIYPCNLYGFLLEFVTEPSPQF